MCDSKHLLSRRVDAEWLTSTFCQLGHRQSSFFHRCYIVTSEPQRITSFLPYTEILQSNKVSVNYSDINIYNRTVNKNHTPIFPSRSGTLTPPTCKLPYKFLSGTAAPCPAPLRRALSISVAEPDDTSPDDFCRFHFFAAFSSRTTSAASGASPSDVGSTSEVTA